jgi:hypothetical protein
MQLALDRSVNRAKLLLYRPRRVRLTAANRINQEQLLLNADRQRLSRAERVGELIVRTQVSTLPVGSAGETPRTQSAAGGFAHTTSQRPRNAARAVRADFRFLGRVFTRRVEYGISVAVAASYGLSERPHRGESRSPGTVISRPRTPRRSSVVGRMSSSEAVLTRESRSSIRQRPGPLSTRRVQALAADFRLGSS